MLKGKDIIYIIIFAQDKVFNRVKKTRKCSAHVLQKQFHWPLYAYTSIHVSVNAEKGLC